MALLTKCKAILFLHLLLFIDPNIHSPLLKVKMRGTLPQRATEHLFLLETK